MAEGLAFLLDWPWGMLDGTARTRITPGSEVRLDPGRAPLLALSEPATGSWQTDRKRSPLQPETPVFGLGSERYWRIWSLPLLRSPDEQAIRLSRAGNESLSVVFDSRSFADDPDANDQDFDPKRSKAVDRMLGLIAALRDDRQYDPLLLSWSDVAERWLRRRKPFDPRLHPIVRHTRSLPSVLADLAAHPRRVLRREHRMLPLDRAQEWDRTTLMWYTRQPGTTLAEKAGPGQTVLALARIENRDTLENRVLRALLELSARSARAWCDAHSSLLYAAEYYAVDRYRGLTRRLAQQLVDAGVRLPGPSPRPNYPLLFDVRYRRVWSAYLELLRLEWQRDEIRRWAHRLFDEIVRILVHATLARSDVEQVSELQLEGFLPLVLRREQERGRFALPFATSMFAVTIDRSFAIQVFEPARCTRSRSAAADELAAWRRVHAALVLRFERPGTDRHAWLGVFAIWEEDWQRAKEQGLPSLRRALQRIAEEIELQYGRKVPVGAVTMVRAEPETPVDYEIPPDGQVLLLRLPVADEPFRDQICYVLRSFFDEFAAASLA